MSDVNIQTFSGKVNVSNNFTVGGGHLFVNTQNNQVGLNTTTPEANLHVTGNTYISTDISVGGTLTMGTVTVEALHSLDAVTSVGNTTPHTVEFQNTDTSLVASGNVEVAKELTVSGNATVASNLTVSGNVEVGTANLFVDTVNSRVAVGTASPLTPLHISSTNEITTSPAGSAVSQMRFGSTNSTVLFGVSSTAGHISAYDTSSFSTHRDLCFNADGGNVGIGTTSPGQKLSIYTGSTGTAALSFDRFASGNYRTDIYQNTYGADFRVGYGTYTPESMLYLKRFSDGAKEVEINGNVGITPQHPRTRLQVGTLLTTTHSDRETIPQSNMGIDADFPRTTSAWFAHRVSDSEQEYWGLAVGTIYSGDSYIQNLNKKTTSYYNLLLQRHGGFVGIRNADPYCPLHVSGYGGGTTNASTHVGFKYNDTSNGHLKTWNGNHTNVGIFADDDIMTHGYVLSINGTFGASDRRIKKDIVDIDDGAALQTLRQLQPKQYKYIDTYRNTSDPVWGFIAQEVRETLPHSTQLRTECIPNITEVVTVSETNVLTFTNFDTSNLEIGTKIRVHDNNNAEHKVKVTDIIDMHSVRIDRDISEWTCSFNEDGTIGEGDSLYVYGQEVDDFVFIKKDAIWTVATAALQEVDRQQQADKARITELETQLASVLARLDALENA